MGGRKREEKRKKKAHSGWDQLLNKPMLVEAIQKWRN